MTIEIRTINDGKKDFMYMCSVCCAIEMKDNSWFYIEDNPDKWEEIVNEYSDPDSMAISHGYCPPCFNKELEKVADLNIRKALTSS